MPSIPNALNAARSSREYLFSVVALAVLLTALAALQWVRTADRSIASSGQAARQPADGPQAATEDQPSRTRSGDRLQAAQAALATARKEQDAALAELDQLNRSAKRLEREIRTQETLADHARRARSQASPSDAIQPLPPVEAEDSQAAALERSLSALQAQRAQFLTRFTPRHPVVQDVDQRMAELEILLQQAQSERTPSPARPVEPTSTAEDGGEERLTATERRLQHLRLELEEVNVSRDEETLRLAELQDALARRLEEIELAQTAEPLLGAGGPPVVEPVATPVGEKRVGPVGLIFSLAIGCVVASIAFVKAKPVSRHFSSRSEIESILALPLIGLLPGTDDSPEPAPLPDLRGVRKIRGAAELVVGAFAVATAAAAATVEGYSERLTNQPLSTVADGFRAMAMHFFG